MKVHVRIKTTHKPGREPEYRGWYRLPGQWFWRRVYWTDFFAKPVYAFTDKQRLLDYAEYRARVSQPARVEWTYTNIEVSS